MVTATQGQGARAMQSPAVNHCGSCGAFMKIPPLIRLESGQWVINPDFDMVKKFMLNASPFPTETGATIAAGGTQDFAFTVPAEENQYGDMLINELLARFVPAGPNAVRNVTVEIVSLQSDKLFMNAPIFNSLLWGNGWQSCCLPCCILIQATNSMTLRVTNGESVAVTCSFVARGRRFLPYHDPSLQARMLAYWNSLPTTPYWLSPDAGLITLAAGATTTVLATVPGGGDFELRRILCDVNSDPADTLPEDIDIQITEGVGRSLMLQPLNLAYFVATSTRMSQNGLLDGMWAAAQNCSCEQYSQLFKRNGRIRIQVTNNGSSTALIRLAFEGCMHYVGECAPGDSLDRVRSLEPTVGPMLVGTGRGMCPPTQAVAPMPGRGLVPVNAQSAPMPQQTYFPQGGIQPPLFQHVLGPGYGAALPGGGLQGMGAMPPGQRRQPNGRWRRI